MCTMTANCPLTLDNVKVCNTHVLFLGESRRGIITSQCKSGSLHHHNHYHRCRFPLTMSYSQLSENARHIVAKFALATSLEVAQGVAWYSVAYDTAINMAEKYALSADTCAGVIAALSPRNKWARNIQDAESIISMWRHGTDEDVLAVKCSTFGAMKAKALKILNSAVPVTDILNGPKLIEFYNCITSNDNDVCIDGHAYSIWLGIRLALKDIPPISKKLRARIKQDYRDATSFINEELNEKYKASDIQAITWVTHKRIHNV